MSAKETHQKLSFDQLPDWVSPEQVRRFLSIGRATCYELIKNRQLPSRKFGRQIRVPKCALTPHSLERQAVS